MKNKPTQRETGVRGMADSDRARPKYSRKMMLDCHQNTCGMNVCAIHYKCLPSFRNAAWKKCNIIEAVFECAV